MKYAALFKDAWQWAKDSKFIWVVGIGIVFLTLASVLLIRISPNPQEFNKNNHAEAIETQGHFYHFRMAREFSSLKELIDYAGDLWWKDYVGQHPLKGGFFVGYMPSHESSGSGDHYAVEEQTDEGKKMVINKDTVREVISTCLNKLFQARTEITQAQGKWMVKATGSIPIKFLPAQITTIFSRKVFQAGTSIALLVLGFQSSLLGFIVGFIGILLGLHATQDFVLKSLQPGRVELELSKPFSREGYLLAKFLGSLLFILFLAAVLVVPLCVGAYLQTGIFNLGFLLTPIFYTVYFACIYVVSFFYTVALKRGGGAWIAFLFWIFTSIVYMAFMTAHSMAHTKESGVYNTFSVLYALLPKTGLISEYTRYYMATLVNLPTQYTSLFGSSPPSYSLVYTFGTSLLFIGVLLALSLFLFRRKSF